MKTVSRLTAIIATLALLLSFCACEKKGYGTLIYGNTDLSEYVKLGKYKGLEIDKSSDKFKQAYEAIVQKDISSIGISETKYEGKVQSGDVANIDYVGKKDGVAFSGGSANGYDLTIGSHTFISGFEDGLIGVNIGDTVDLNLTFPTDYKSADLAGKAVVFTVKVNYVKTTTGIDPKNHCSELGFSSFDAYKKDAEERAAKNLLFEAVLEKSEVKSCPQADKETFINAVYNYYDILSKANNGYDFKTVLTSKGMTVDSFKKQISESAESQLKDQMIYYAILQKEELSTKWELTDKEKKSQAVLDEITRVENVVRDYLYKNANIK